MKAVVYEKYGSPDVLELKEIEKPVPKDNEVLIKVRAALVTKGDCEIRSFEIPNMIWLLLRIFLFGLIKPRKKILGAYLSGVIESVGNKVKRFRPGDKVCACTGASFGAYTKYICMPEEGGIAIKPENTSYEEASAIPIGIDALHFLRKANIHSGENVLINGAGGSIGTFAVQLAKHYGAQVTAVDSTEKLDMLLSIGADHVIDYTKEDFSKNGEVYDVIFDLVCKNMYSRCLRSLKQDGRYILANPSGISQMLRGLFTSMTGGKKVISQFASVNTEDLIFLKELIEAGKLKTVMDRGYPIEQVADAHRYIESGRKKGNVAITV